MSKRKTEAIKKGIEMGIFREGSSYHGDFFHVGVTEEFLDIYDEHLYNEMKREEAIRKSVLDSYSDFEGEVDNELMAIIILILGSSNKLLSQSVSFDKFGV